MFYFLSFVNDYNSVINGLKKKYATGWKGQVIGNDRNFNFKKTESVERVDSRRC